MESIPLEHGLILAAILFSIGLIGVLTRRNIVFVLMSLEIMLNAGGLAFIVAASRWGHAEGQIMFLMIRILLFRKNLFCTKIIRIHSIQLRPCDMIYWKMHMFVLLFMTC